MLVARHHQKLILNLRDPARVMTVIPTAAQFEYRGKVLVAVPHRPDEVQVLRNLGFDAPAPVRYYYDFPGRYRPFDHQIDTVEFLIEHPRCFCLNDMGTGKTLSVLWAFDYLRRLGMCQRMLIISPLSSLERTWGDEIFRNFPELTFGVMHGTRAHRHAMLSNKFDIYIINHDGIKSAETLALLGQRKDLDLVVVDEIASFRNSQTERWKALKRVVAPRPRVWGLTGTPTPNAPTDAWAQARLINPANVPDYFSQFRDLVMRRITNFKWGARDGALGIVHRAMQPAIRFARDDCLTLPPTTYVTREAELTAEQRAAYNDMTRKLRAEVAGGQITAVNEAVKLGKLVQICCGVAYGDPERIEIPAKPRIELVRELIEEAGAKVIVFVPLTGALQRLADELRKDFSVEVVHGDVSKSERDRIFSAFQLQKDPHVIVANPGTMSHSLTLVAANTIIWFAPITSNETYEQANARIVRAGQKLNTLIVHIEGSAVERQMYDRLQKRQKLQGLLLDMLKEM